MSTDAPSTTLDPATLVRGAVGGAVAFLLGYAVTYVTAVDAGSTAAGAFEPLASAGGRFAPAWKVAGWLFADAHFVGTRTPAITLDLVALASVEFLYAVPVLFLLVAGGAAARYDRARTPRAGLEAGLATVVGYLPLAVFAALVAGYANVGPSLLRMVVVAGVVYPVALGSVGGAVVGWAAD